MRERPNDHCHKFAVQDSQSKEVERLTPSLRVSDELTKRHTPMIFRIAMHIAGSREDAEDIVQDAFLKAFLHLQGFEERSRFSTWVTRIAANEALTRLRRSRRSPTVSIDDRTDENMSL
jgi:RNA polymerase sigma factor (sigma-70 family)